MCELPSNFGELTKLTRLHLDENQLRALPDGFGGLVSLKFLDLCAYSTIYLRDIFNLSRKRLQKIVGLTKKG